MQKLKTIPFCKTGYFSKIICDYLDKSENLSEFYENTPDMDGFKKQIKAKRESFPDKARKILVNSLLKQNKNFDIPDKTKINIQLLSKKDTFTVTTGHQLNLFTGPLYFLYKIVATINLSERLKKEFPDCNFVPVYWMATEDHDFEEIKFFHYKNKEISWNRDSNGAVGRLSSEGLNEVFEEFSRQLGKSKNAEYLRKLFHSSYLKHDNLTDATRFLANELFGEHGLVIVNGDDKVLKKQFIPFVKEELFDQTCFRKVSKANERLGANYKIQVNPREINLFYLDENVRERIVVENDSYNVLNTNISFTKEQILLEVENNPEKFSPNVLMRPLFQEVVLPNLCYIGGGGELSYWFELKDYFESQKVPFPVLLLRNSLMLISEKQLNKMKKLDIKLEDLFLKQNDLVNKKVRHISDVNIDLSDKKEQLKKMFLHLEELSENTDRSFTGAVKAQGKKQQNGLENLEKRLLKAKKRKYKEIVNRITDLQDGLFPNQILQEREANFAEFYEEVGEELISGLIQNLDPLLLEFDVVEI